MDLKINLTPQDWARLRRLGSACVISVGLSMVKKIKARKRRWTDDAAIEIHIVTKGEIPCWVLRPDLWAPGQIPPAVAAVAA